MDHVKVYYDLMSQVSRAVVLFLRVNNIKFSEKPVALRKGEHMTDWYGDITPFRRVPVIDDNGFILTESVAILKYFVGRYQAVCGVPDHWYPAEPRARGRVDEYMAWQHINTRMNAAMVFRIQVHEAILKFFRDKYNTPDHWYPTDLYKRARVNEYIAWHHSNTRTSSQGVHYHQVIEPRAKNIPVDQEKLRKFQAQLEDTLDAMETYFLRDKQYLCGDEISIADVLAICELMQPIVTGQDVTADRPRLRAWMERVKGRLQPHFDEVHKVLYAVRDKYLESQARM